MYDPLHDDDDDEGESVPQGSNWGKKRNKGARWIHRGKMAAWGPGMKEWEADERARKRVKLLLSQRRSPSPPSLPHLRSASPPLSAPYPSPTTHHPSYASLILDKSITHSFRCGLLDDLEQATNGLIEDEANLRKALGRLWQVVSESPDDTLRTASPAPKQENDDEKNQEDDQGSRITRAPDLVPPVHKVFITSYPFPDPSQVAAPLDAQMDVLNKALVILRELQDDGREYVERLQEIREGIGDAKAQRGSIWDMVRERAIEEIENDALGSLS